MPALEGRVLNTGPPGRTPNFNFFNFVSRSIQVIEFEPDSSVASGGNLLEDEEGKES